MNVTGTMLFINGASRDVRPTIASRSAYDGTNVVIATGTMVPHPKRAGPLRDAVRAIFLRNARPDTGIFFKDEDSGE